jgi:methionyl-tRNA synthetase
MNAMAETRAIWAAGNEYLTQAAPWTHYKSDVDQAAMGVRVGLNLVALFGVLAQPIIPDAAEKILAAMSIPEENRTWNFRGGESCMNALPIAHPVSAPPVLFTKIEADDIDAWTERFGGAG